METTKFVEDVAEVAASVGVEGGDAFEFSWPVVFFRVVEGLERNCTAYNAARVREYQRQWDKAMELWKSKRYKMTLPSVPLARRIEYDVATYTLGNYVDGPEMVIDPEPLPPWELLPDPSPQPPEQGFVEWIEGGVGYWLAGNSNVPEGTVKVCPHDGKQYRLGLLGKLGSIVYVKMWILVG